MKSNKDHIQLWCSTSQIANTTMSNIEADARTYFCKSGYYNDMATLFFNSQEEAIKQLFHQPGKIATDIILMHLCFIDDNCLEWASIWWPQLYTMN